MLELVGQLRGMLSPRGVLAFTFSDPLYDSSLSAAFPDPSYDPPEIEPKTHTTSRPRWCMEIDDELYLEPEDELCQQELPVNTGESYCSYFTGDYMKSLFPDATVLSPIGPEWQH